MIKHHNMSQCVQQMVVRIIVTIQMVYRIVTAVTIQMVYRIVAAVTLKILFRIVTAVTILKHICLIEWDIFGY